MMCLQWLRAWLISQAPAIQEETKEHKGYSIIESEPALIINKMALAAFFVSSTIANSWLVEGYIKVVFSTQKLSWICFDWASCFLFMCAFAGGRGWDCHVEKKPSSLVVLDRKWKNCHKSTYSLFDVKLFECSVVNRQNLLLPAAFSGWVTLSSPTSTNRFLTKGPQSERSCGIPTVVNGHRVWLSDRWPFYKGFRHCFNI